MSVRTILFPLGLLLAVGLGLGGWTDALAAEALQASTERALASFGIAKAINAVISLLQGTELSFTPMGVGLTLTVGELLDPLNDMVERFSWIMLFASASLLIQSFLMKLASSLLLKTLLLLAAAALGLLLWRPALLAPYRAALLRLFLVILFVRFFVVGIVALETMSFQTLLLPTYTEATAQLEQTHRELRSIESATEEPGWFGHSRAMLELKQRLEQLETQFGRAQNEMISLIAVFVFQTILVPLFFLWLTVGLLKWALRSATYLHSVAVTKPLTEYNGV